MGASCLIGGSRDGSVVAPTILSNLRSDVTIMCEEVFGPVVLVCEFDDFQQAMNDVNNTPYGLATGVFTRNVGEALAAIRALRVGSVNINETSSSRVDLMPDGGVKLSGLGQESPRYAIEEMTEEHLITIGDL
jgi:succinate-semialdehyde dehydrogenase/glutarate-semialdehyde dehydrogenase